MDVIAYSDSLARFFIIVAAKEINVKTLCLLSS